ncbi:MAG TPA: lipid II flippase MurJ [Alphaproteobacteria bacterium]|nr:lipid II flippase MurJ [Alphaproteobacteria bacterium]
MRELVIAAMFGTNPSLGAYLLAALLPTYVAQIFSSAAPLALVPTFIHVRDRNGREAAQRLAGAATIMAIGALGVAVLAVLALFPLYLEKAATTLGADERRLTIELLLILAPFALLRGVTALWAAMVNVAGAFFAPALLPALTPLVAASAALTFRGEGVKAIALGTLVGIVLETVLTAMLLRKAGVAMRWSWPAYTAELRHVVRQFLPTIAGSATLATIAVIDQTTAAMMSPAGISVIYYANLLVLFPILLAAPALSVAALPHVSEMAACHRWRELRHTISVYVRYVLAATVPLTAIFCAFSPLIVRVVFHRGNFSADDVAAVAQVVRYLSLQIPFYLGATVVVQVLSALGRNDILMWSALLSVALKILLNYFLSSMMGLAGLGLSTSVIYAVAMVFLLTSCLWTLRRHQDG